MKTLERLQVLYESQRVPEVFVLIRKLMQVSQATKPYYTVIPGFVSEIMPSPDRDYIGGGYGVYLNDGKGMLVGAWIKELTTGEVYATLPAIINIPHFDKMSSRDYNNAVEPAIPTIKCESIGDDGPEITMNLKQLFSVGIKISKLCPVETVLKYLDPRKITRLLAKFSGDAQLSLDTFIDILRGSKQLKPGKFETLLDNVSYSQRNPGCYTATLNVSRSNSVIAFDSCSSGGSLVIKDVQLYENGDLVVSLKNYSIKSDSLDKKDVLKTVNSLAALTRKLLKSRKVVARKIKNFVTSALPNYSNIKLDYDLEDKNYVTISVCTKSASNVPAIKFRVYVETGSIYLETDDSTLMASLQKALETNLSMTIPLNPAGNWGTIYVSVMGLVLTSTTPKGLVKEYKEKLLKITKQAVDVALEEYSKYVKKVLP